MKRLFKITAFTLAVLLLLLTGVLSYIEWGLAPDEPKPKDLSVLSLVREQQGGNFYSIGNNWLQQNKYGIWEEYIEGDPFERGVVAGKLNKEMLYTQEEAFVEQIHRLVPNEKYLRFLHLVARVFNRDLDRHIPEEFRQEIYGESLSAPHEFDYISPAYDRILNYHAAHDIGHAFQSLALVGCTSFSVWGPKSEDSILLIGRNLDFSMGDKFAKDKIVLFCNPSNGHRFAMVTWAGFFGCVSGMNEKGLTVTINAAQSDMPNKAAMPISLLAREILQYASTVEEAYSIARKRKTFVCETLMIGSALDGQTALIEKSISKTELLKADSSFILCTNHYQSKAYENDENNLENMKRSASMYRYQRLEELINRFPRLSYTQAASILRDQRGLQDRDIGMGNEKSINQLLSHHAVIFQPEKKRMWVTANPYQLGAFVCYDLGKIFSEAPTMKGYNDITDSALLIPADTFLHSASWKNFLLFKELKQTIAESIRLKKRLNNDNGILAELIASNPEFWESYYWVASYHHSIGNYRQAKQYYETALTKEINDQRETDKIWKELKKIKP